jgi:hypothetical protein
MFRKVMFYVGVAMTLIVAVFVSGTASLMLGLVTLLAGLQVYGKKDLRLWIIVLSIIFIFVNLFSVFSLADVAFWGLMLWAFARK